METILEKEKTAVAKGKKTSYTNEAELIHKFSILFENINKQAKAHQELEDYGYTEEEIAKGKALYDKCYAEYQTKITEMQAETSAHYTFKQKLDDFLKEYSEDRQKARIAFKGKEDVITNLRLKGKNPQSISGILKGMALFYNSFNTNKDLLNFVARYQIDDNYIQEQLRKLSEVEKAYAHYSDKKGDSQQATINKNEALKALKIWVSEFFAIAKIALKHKPQLLESLGKVVK